MKYWCYYTDVVRYLEKLEALHAPKTKAPAYLIWQDDGGPSMIVGPGVEWYRGDGPATQHRRHHHIPNYESRDRKGAVTSYALQPEETP